MARTVLGALSFPPPPSTSQVLWGQDLPPGTAPNPSLFITPVGCQGPTQPPAFLCHLQGILRVPGSIVRGAQS